MTRQDHQGTRWLVFAAVLLFAAHAFVEIKHELWRDEYQQWLIVRASAGPLSLFHHLRYEGHPIIWYLCLLILSKFTSSIVAVKAFGVAISSVTGVLILRYAPFKMWQRIAIVAGYFTFYEYGTIVRSYSLGLLFLVILFTYLRRQNKNWSFVLPMCALCLWTSVQTGVVAFAIAAVTMWPSFAGLTLKRKVAVILCCLAIGAIYVLQVVHAATPVPLYRPLEGAVQTVFGGMFPVPQFKEGFDNTSILDSTPFVEFVCGAIALFAVPWTMRARLGAVMGWVIGASGLFALEISGPAGIGLRHSGHFFVLAIGLAWIAWDDISNTERDWFTWNKLFGVLLAGQLIAGAWAIGADLAYPFTQAQATASWIRAHPATGARPACIMGQPDYRMVGVAARLGIPYYSMGPNRFETYMRWGGARSVPFDSTGEIALRDSQRLGCEPTLLVPVPLPDANSTGWHLVAKFTHAIRDDEVYWVYRLN